MKYWWKHESLRDIPHHFKGPNLSTPVESTVFIQIEAPSRIDAPPFLTW